MYTDLPSEQIEVSFPTLFIAASRYSELPRYEPDEVNVIWEMLIGETGKYDYDLGSGWIYHSRGSLNFRNTGRYTESLGWIYIRHYPWV
jgi:hypothetical protein